MFPFSTFIYNLCIHNNMSAKFFGRHSLVDAQKKSIQKYNTNAPTNNLTRRNALLLQVMPARTLSTSLQSANLKSLRLFRHICRLMPFIVKTHELQHRITPVQASRYVANHFRKNSKETNLMKIDNLVQVGYQEVLEAEMQYTSTGYLYQFLMPQTHKKRDHGVDTFEENKANKLNKEAPTKFLKTFYTGKKTHYV